MTDDVKKENAMSAATVLLADDDPLFRKSMSTRLCAAGFEVLEARDGRDAIDLARRHRPDVLVLDVHMPAGDGYNVIDRLDTMSDLGGLPVIYISGDHAQWLDAAALERGAEHVLHKPFAAEDLIRAVRIMLGEMPLTR